MAVIRCGKLYALIGESVYPLGIVRNISCAPNLYNLTQLGGGEGQIDNVSVNIELASIPVASEYIINKHCSLVWMQADYGESLTYTVKQLKDVVLVPPARSAVAKGSGSTSATTLSLSGTAYLDYDDEYQETPRVFSSLDLALEYLDGIVGGSDDES